MQTSTTAHIPTSAGTAVLFTSGAPLRMDCGASLAPVSVSYETYGTLNAEGDNAILVCHALTGNAHAAGGSENDRANTGWWEGFIGPERGLDTSKYFVISSNFLGGCYGTTGSISVNPATGAPYGLAFPQMTVRDMVRVQRALVARLGVRRLATVAGGSLGGMQALEWAVMFPELVSSVIPIATATQHSPWCIGLNEIARQAIMSDPEWRGGAYYGHSGPAKGLSIARQIAMMSYRSDISFQNRFGRERQELIGAHRQAPFASDGLFKVESYLHYQGEKLVRRFDANTYLYITKAMDLHDLAAGRGELLDVLRSIRMPVLSVGITSDILYPVHEQRTIAGTIPGASYVEIDSPFGHDAFLIESDQLNSLVRNFLTSNHL